MKELRAETEKMLDDKDDILAAAQKVFEDQHARDQDDYDRMKRCVEALRDARAKQQKIHNQTTDDYKQLIEKYDAKDEEAFESHRQERAEWRSTKQDMQETIDTLNEQSDAWCAEVSDAMVVKELGKPSDAPETPPARKRKQQQLSEFAKSACKTPDPCTGTRSAAKRLRF